MATGFEVTAITDCAHVAEAVRSTDGTQGTLPALPTACAACGPCEELWVCLTCWCGGCSRGEGGHAAEHYARSGHPIALGLADMSAWCYKCEAYLDVFNIVGLHASFTHAYRARFGEDPVLPVISLATVNSGAGSAAGAGRR